MTAFGNTWLLAFALSALAALLDAVLGDVRPVAAARGALFGAVFVGAPLVWAGLVSPRLPKAVFLPPLLFLPFSLCGGMPLPLFVPFARLDLAVSSLQVAVAVLALLHVRVRFGSFLLPHTPARAIGLRDLLGWAVVCGVALPLGLLLYAGASASIALERFTGGFVRIESRGLVAEERSYARDGSSVRLVPMVHVARSAYYDEIQASLPRDGGIVLLEGMSDHEARLREDLSYAPVASALGLEAQEHALEPGEGHITENADLDVSALSPETVELVESSALVLGAATSEERTAAWARTNELVRTPGVVERAAAEVIGMRNRHLLGRIDAALERHAQVVVPWGAAHMPELEQGLLERGFAHSGSAPRAVILFSELGP